MLDSTKRFAKTAQPPVSTTLGHWDYTHDRQHFSRVKAFTIERARVESNLLRVPMVVRLLVDEPIPIAAPKLKSLGELIGFLEAFIQCSAAKYRLGGSLGQIFDHTTCRRA